MKPHSLRRILWISNLALGAAVVGVLAWFVLDVRPAVGEVVNRPRGFQPERYKAMKTEYDNMRATGLKWTPEMPVSETDFRDTILRPDYAKRNPKHWIFSGPLPPPIETAKPVGPVEPPAPPGLDSIGAVSMILIENDPPRKSMLFAFAGGKKSRAFRVGTFVKADPGDADRFKITDIVEVRPRVYEIRYDVYGSDKDKPERSAALTYDTAVSGPPPPFLRPVGADGRPLATPGAAPGSAPGTAAGATPATAEGGTPGEAPAGAQPATPAVVHIPTEDLTIEQLHPTIRTNPRNATQRVVEFDDRAHRYFKGKNVASIAETVKTEVHRDPNTNRVVGLRIAGFTEGAPADVFDVRKGDILVSINGTKITSKEQAISFGKTLDPKKIATVVIDRNGRLLTYKVDPQDPHTKRRIRYFDDQF